MEPGFIGKLENMYLWSLIQGNKIVAEAVFCWQAYSSSHLLLIMHAGASSPGVGWSCAVADILNALNCCSCAVSQMIQILYQNLKTVPSFLILIQARSTHRQVPFLFVILKKSPRADSPFLYQRSTLRARTITRFLQMVVPATQIRIARHEEGLTWRSWSRNGWNE